MRIIAGAVGGRVLAPPPSGVRPTMDRVRAAIFSSLGDAVPGARVLDLFAGSGAMGIEALSRGADSAVFVDENPRCASCVRDNLRRTGLEGSVQTMDAFRFLEMHAAGGFNLIFADPPYAKVSEGRDFAAELLALPCWTEALRPGGTLILERARRREEPPSPGLSLLRVRRYGDAEIATYIAAK